MRFACWVTKAKNRHSEYVIVIAFPRQQWLHERPSMLRYTYIICLGGLVLGRCLGSNLGYPNRDSTWFAQVPPGKCQRITFIRLTPVYSESFTVYRS